MIANIVGNMSDRYWEQFRKVEPCGRPGCDCHLTIALHGTKLFELIREDFLATEKPKELAE